MSKNTIKITALKVDQLAKLLSNATGRNITVEQVRQVANMANIIGPDDTVNLIEYTAFLVGKVVHGSN